MKWHSSVTKIPADPAGHQGDIYLGRDLFQELPPLLTAYQGKKAAILTDQNVANLYGERLRKGLAQAGIEARLVIVPVGEQSKDIGNLPLIYGALVAFGLERSDLLIGLGGGMVCDLAGFVAATYLRGIALCLAPSSLLAQVDAAVGGKNAVNLKDGKNLVGTFYPAQLTFMDADLLTTLPERELTAALAEIVKYAVLQGGDLWTKVNDLPRVSSKKSFFEMLQPLIGDCVNLKLHYVHDDPYDHEKRQELNFGHSFGHALEMLDAGYNHGEGVAWGMVAASFYGQRQGLTPEGLTADLAALLQRQGLLTPLAAVADQFSQLCVFLSHDKKSQAGEVLAVIPEGLGRMRFLPLDKKEQAALALAAFDYPLAGRQTDEA